MRWRCCLVPWQFQSLFSTHPRRRPLSTTVFRDETASSDKAWAASLLGRHKGIGQAGLAWISQSHGHSDGPQSGSTSLVCLSVRLAVILTLFGAV